MYTHWKRERARERERERVGWGREREGRMEGRKERENGERREG